MIAVPGYVVVLVMVIHGMLAFLTSQTQVVLEPIWNVAIGATLVGLNIFANAVKPLTAAIRRLGESS